MAVAVELVLEPVEMVEILEEVEWQIVALVEVADLVSLLLLHLVDAGAMDADFIGTDTFSAGCGLTSAMSTIIPSYEPPIMPTLPLLPGSFAAHSTAS